MRHRYVPIVSCKKAELNALAELPQRVRDAVLPLVDIRDPEPSRIVPGRRHKPFSPSERLKSLADDPKNGLVGTFSGTDRFLLDVGRVNPHILERGQHPASWLLLFCKDLGLEPIPVIGRSREPDYRKAIARVVRDVGNGACIRVLKDHLTAGSSGLAHILHDLDLPRAQVDLVIDLEDVPIDRGRFMSRVAHELLEGFRPLTSWRSVSLGAGAFPRLVSDHIDYDSHGTLARTDWQTWQHTCSELGGTDVAFGDYGVVSPSDSPGWLGAANIRYARQHDWLVIRGTRPNPAPPSGDYNRLARQLMATQSDFDATHCPGCVFISSMSEKTGGNATQWRQAGFSHHFASVLDLLGIAA